jgi:chromate transporter
VQEDKEGEFRPSLLTLTLLFALFSATNFGGGGSARIRRAFVRDRKWISESDFIELLALGQICPGPNQTNLAVLIGQRYHGTLGAIVGFVGVTVPGFLVLMVFAAIYFNWQHSPYVQAALHGCAAAAVGLSASNAIELSKRQLRKPVALAFLVATALAVSAFHASLALVVFTLGVASIAYNLVELFRAR